MREYVKPTMEGELFAANEYIAACGDSGVTYYFECNAGKKGNKYDVITSNGVNLTPDGFLRLGYYNPCEEKHVAESNDEFIEGYLCYTDGKDREIKGSYKEKVIIWTDGGTNVHCTKNLNMDNWETAKS